jgi:hypothetical protein
MSEVDTQPSPSATHWIYKTLAVLLTLAIVAVVFWQNRPTGDPGSADGNYPPATSNFPGEIQPVGEGMWRITGGQAVVFAAGDPADRFEFRMRMFGMMADEDTRTLMRAYRVLMNDERARSTLELTSEQSKQLQAIDAPRMVVNDTDRAEFVSRFHAWQRADDAHKPQAQTAVCDQLKEISARGAPLTKQAWVDGCAKLKKILTLQQMAKLTVYMESNPTPGMGWGNPFAPTSTSQPLQ